VEWRVSDSGICRDQGSDMKNIEVTFRFKPENGEILEQRVFVPLEDLLQMKTRRSYQIESKFHSFIDDIIFMGALDK
jgi:hypothetical protein